jgi:hypothetical protein
MKLTLFHLKGSEELRIGAIKPDAVVDVTAALGSPVSSMRRFLELGAPALATASAAFDDARFSVPLDGVVLMAPIYDSEKVLCVGMNYV